MKKNLTRSFVHLVALIALLPWANATQGAEPFTGSQLQAVRSILSNRCFACHGPDDAERKGGFRLDGDSIVNQVGESGMPLVARGGTGSGELMRRILSQDESERMPPPEFGKPLTEAEASLVKRWVEQGAPALQHWAFVPPVRRDPPAVSAESLRQVVAGGDKQRAIDIDAWLSQPIDRFVLQSQLDRKLTPSPQASREALIRRLSLDLTGLPPDLQRVDDFVADKRPDAVERLIDRLLASPTYGEHWARKWLDMARYADSAGYADDPPRTIWAYRDWVVRAINSGMDIEQFTLEQLAGDLLPNPTEDQLTATAFHRNTLTNNEGGTNDEEFRNVAVIDRVNTTLAVWMGITFSCAQCHNHKYDPYHQSEYFQVFDIFNQSQDADRRDESPFIELMTADQKQMMSDLKSKLQSLQSDLNQVTPELRAELAAFGSAISKLEWQELSVASATSKNLGAIKPTGSKVVLTRDKDSKHTGTIQLVVATNDTVSAKPIESLELDFVSTKASDKPQPLVINKVRATLVPQSSTGKSARFVRVELPGKNRMLSLAEIQVFSGETNVALAGTAKQSSTDYGGDAKRAIDGNTSGNYDDNSTTHTASSNSPWWEVDLGSNQAIQRVVLWNRTGAGLPERLNGAKLLLLDDQRKEVSTVEIPKAPETSQAFEISGEIALQFAQAMSDSTRDEELRSIVSNEKGKGLKIAGQPDRLESLRLLLDKPIAIPAGMRLHVELDLDASGTEDSAIEISLQATSAKEIRMLAQLDSAVRAQVSKLRDEKLDDTQQELLKAFATKVAPSRDRVRKEIAETEKKLAAIKPVTSVPIMRDMDQDKKRKTFVQLRGNYKSLGAQVEAGVPKVFASAMSQEGDYADSPSRKMDRLDLARWLMAKQNPLTARVFANRYWEALFGLGIVRTSEEFGSQGDLPSHPELLDWLADELIQQGWDHKRFLRMIARSQTYQQTSEVSKAALDADADNVWLARGPRVRLPAESVRDAALASAGLLTHKMYGPPVRPPQPNMGLSAAFGSKTDWETSQGEDRYRRGLYTTWRRSNPYPSMATFDAPSREVCTLKRDSTNTPLQALVTLNDPGFVEAAQGLARRVVLYPNYESNQIIQNDRDRLQLAFRLAAARFADESELSALERLLNTARKKLADQLDAAKQLATDPIGPLPTGADAVELAAWTSVMNVILNLDEVLMKR